VTAVDRDSLRVMVRDAVREALAELKVASLPGVPDTATKPRTGLVNEKAIAAMPEGATIRLAPGAVVTPLARDRARARRIKLERIR
jgi:hypothetical protein